MEHEQTINAYVCQYCKGSFDKLENLSKHVLKIHTVSSSGKENRICPLCGTQCIKTDGYRNHLRHIHGHNEEGQVVVFKSFNDFLVWKNELEKRNYCKYVMRDPPKKLPSNDKIHIYRCDSSVGSMKEKRSGVAARESCPAVITAIESAKTKGVKIEHWNSHVGHIIPVEEDELDAAIGSLGTTEIVLTSDQRYQYEGQSADGNMFFITESNDGSLSETFVKEVPKKSNLFQNTRAKTSNSISKPASQKFSYKKDPTKKSGSFNYSLASVACMKPSGKKKIIAPPAVTTTSSVEDSASTSVTNSDALLLAPVSSVTSSEIELATESISDVVNDDTSPNTDIPINTKEKETPVSVVSPSKTITLSNSCSLSNQTFEFINDGSLSGQVVLLNSLTGQNSNQSIVLSADQKFISIGPAINVGTISPKKGKGSKKNQKSKAASQIIVIPTPSEKENVSSVQNILNLSQNKSPIIPTIQVIPAASEKENVSSAQNILNISENPIPLDSGVKSPGPSILKKAKKSVQKPSKKSIVSSEKNSSFSKKNAVSPTKKAISAKQKLNLGLNPSLDVFVDLSESATCSLAGNVKVPKSVPLEVTDSTSNISTRISHTVSITPVPTTCASLIPDKFQLPIPKNLVSSAAQNSVSSTIQSSVSSTAPICVSSAAQHSVSSSLQPVSPIFLNSFPPGQTFMSINNNLIPIGTPTAPLLPTSYNPSFVLASSIPPSPVASPSRPMMTYSRFSQYAPRLPGTPSTPHIRPYIRTRTRLPSTGTAVRQKTPPHTSAVPFLLIPDSGSQMGPSVPFSSPYVGNSVNSTISPSIRPIKTQPIISSTGCSVLPRPLISNTRAPVFTQISPRTRLISTPIIPGLPVPFLSSNGQRISRPLLQNIPFLTSPGQQVSRSILQSLSLPAPLIGQPPVLPVGPRAIVSTTVSNAIKVQKVQLPFSKAAIINPSVTLTGSSNITTSLSESTNVSSVVLNTEPISSAPAISIPPLASIGSHKPGSVIFESQGDMYMLEPVEDNSQISNDTSAKNVPNKMSIAVPSVTGNPKSNKSDEAGESSFERSKVNSSSLLKEKAMENQSTLDTKADGRHKSLSPRKTADIKNGVQIKSIVQEKRHLKDDDVEILKKVKYYQMEMKYLASQAECKRLKLELARAQIKNKETVKTYTDLLSGETSWKEDADEDALHIDMTSDKNSLELKQTSSADDVVEDMSMDIDNASHEVNDKTMEDQAICFEAKDNIESTNQCDADSGDSNLDSDIHTDSAYSNCGGNSPADSLDSNHSDVDQPLKEDKAKDSLDNQSSNTGSEVMNCDSESDIGSKLETQNDACNSLNEESQNIGSLENESNNFNLCIETNKTDSNEEPKGIDQSELLNVNNTPKNQSQNLDEELMDFSEIEENFKNCTKDNITVNHSENENQCELQELGNEEMCVQKNNLEDKGHLVQSSELCRQETVNEDEDLMDLDGQNNNSLESEKVDLPCEKIQFSETLKELEFQYGKEGSSDIYTMIRTSVLRCLYDDMKILCEENKKLYDKLQNCSSQEDSSEADKLL